MAIANLSSIMEQLPHLEVNELRQLDQAVQQRLAPVQLSQDREAFRRALLSSGLIKAIKPTRRTSGEARSMMEFAGKPISETIIEERR